MNLRYASLRTLAGRIADYFPGFHALPFNRYSESGVESAERWWVTSTENGVAFPFGKVTISTREKNREPGGWIPDGHVFVGYNVEKGIVDATIKGPSYVLKPDWFWHRFLGLSPSQLEIAIGDAGSVGTNIVFSMSSAVEVPFDSKPAPWDRVTFECDSGKLLAPCYHEGDRSLGPMAKASSVSELLSELRSATAKHPWNWFDLCIGTFYTHDATGPDGIATVPQLLDPFRRWMV